MSASEALPDWQSCRLGDGIARVVGGGTPSRAVLDYWTGPFPWASVKDFRDEETLITDTEEHISLAGLVHSAANSIEPGMPLVCTRMAVGRAAVADRPVAINQDVKALYPRSHVDKRFLLHLLALVRPQLESLSIGSTVKGLSVRDLLNLRVNLPPLQEQCRIAEILDTADAAIGETEALISKLKHAKIGLMHDLLTRGLDERGQLRDPDPEQFKDSPLGRIPREWEVTEVTDIASDVTDGDHHTPERSSKGVFLLSARNVLNGRLALEDVDFVPEREYRRMIRRCYPEPGDILISCSGTIGRVCEVPAGLRCALVRSAALIKLHSWRCQARFAEWVLQSSSVQRQILREQLQAAQPNLFQGSIRRLLVPLPSISEQHRIAEILDAHDAHIRAEEAYREKLKLQKKGLMEDLLTGRVRVNAAREVGA